MQKEKKSRSYCDKYIFILLLQPFAKPCLASLDSSELSQHQICFWSSRIQVPQTVLWDGAKLLKTLWVRAASQDLQQAQL